MKHQVIISAVLETADRWQIDRQTFGFLEPVSGWTPLNTIESATKDKGRKNIENYIIICLPKYQNLVSNILKILKVSTQICINLKNQK